MNKAFTLVVLMLVCAVSRAEPVLLGQWRSDKQKTVSFAKKHAKLEDKTILFLEQLMGRLTLTFAPDHVTSTMPDWQSETAAAVKSKFPGFQETHAYKVLGTTATQVAISTVEPVTSKKIIMIYNFDDEDTMWIYLASETFPQLNFREYFVRIQ